MKGQDSALDERAGAQHVYACYLLRGAAERVIVTVDETNGRATHIERIMVHQDELPKVGDANRDPS